MMHREGTVSLIASLILFVLLSFIISKCCPALLVFAVIIFAILYFLLLWFFRNPNRILPISDDSKIIAPADGKLVVIEKTIESEYFKEERIQLSIFMSPLNVHVNRNPISGKVLMAKYHPGKYLVAWNPKSSTENERTTIVVQNSKAKILFRQIAGALARRIVYYIKEGDSVKQGEEMGFIKFGSRVDLFLPLDAKILVDLNQDIKGSQTILAELP